MKHQLSRPSDVLISMATAGTVWMLVGVPVAAFIAASRVFVWVIASFPEMAVTAAVLGAMHGLWLHLAGRSSESKRQQYWFSAVSGGVLGVLGFPPVFSRSNVVANESMVAVFLLAVVCGGIAAGVASATVLAIPMRGSRSTLNRSVIVGALLVASILAIDFRFYGASTISHYAYICVASSTQGVAGFQGFAGRSLATH